MKYSREYLERLAGQTNFPADTLEKVLRLERLLDQVTGHPFLGTRLVLKGGTALNLFYGRAPRLSVDLDFNYVGALDREEMLRERPHVERAVEQIAAGEGYRVQRGPEEQHPELEGLKSRVVPSRECAAKATGMIRRRPDLKMISGTGEKLAVPRIFIK